MTPQQLDSRDKGSQTQAFYLTDGPLVNWPGSSRPCRSDQDARLVQKGNYLGTNLRPIWNRGTVVFFCEDENGLLFIGESYDADELGVYFQQLGEAKS